MENQTPAQTPPAQPTQPQEPQVTLDDLFPKSAPAQPQQTQAPQPNTPPQTPDFDNMDEEQRKFYQSLNHSTEQKVKEATQKVENAVNTTVESVNKVVSRQTELVKFFNSDKGKAYQPYMEEITKVATDPRYLDVKLDRVIPFTLGSDVIMSIAAKQKAEADSGAAAAGTGGNGQGTPAEKQPIDYFSMSQDEFKQVQDQVRMGTFKAK